MPDPQQRYSRGAKGKANNNKKNAFWQTLRTTRERHLWDTPSSESASRSNQLQTAACGLIAPRAHLTVNFEGPKCEDCEALE